jgi:ubiquinone/menaquinone biosynthesis C-methylase UbiE
VFSWGVIIEKKQHERYVPALRYRWLTRLYDPIVAITTRETEIKRRLLRQAAPPPGADLLDLGCGTGTLMIAIASDRPDLGIVGLDPDPTALAIAGRKAAAAGIELQLDRGFASELPYPDSSFDRVLSSFVFHHLTPEGKRRTVGEIHRVLRPGGELHVADWGKPASAVMQACSYPMRILDGFDRTRDNIEGRLPALFEQGGLRAAATRGEASTLYGTLAFYSARRP